MTTNRADTPMTLAPRRTTSRQRDLRALLAGALVALLVLLAPGLARAQAWEDFYKLGNDAYNASKYSEAVSNYARAIQTAPASAQRAYLNMARAYNQLQQFEHAQQYYLWYLELVPDDRKAAGELKRVEKKTRSKTATPIASESQTAALGQLEQALADGVFMSDSGGALAFYDVLMRTGYAAPSLLALQKALAEGLLAEAARLATPEAMQAAPTLDRRGWEGVRTRIDRASGFADAPLDAARVSGLLATATGWQDYLKADYAEAAEAFDRALKHDASLLAAHWGRALATLTSDTSADLGRAFAAIDAAQAAFEAAGRAPEPFFPVLRAKALQAIGRTEEAADLLLAL